MSFEKDPNIQPPRKRGFNTPHVVISGIEKPRSVRPVRPNITQRLAMEAEKKKIEKNIDNTKNAGMM